MESCIYLLNAFHEDVEDETSFVRGAPTQSMYYYPILLQALHQHLSRHLTFLEDESKMSCSRQLEEYCCSPKE
ncbi:hypothetical protein CDL15_Pgr022537 [Punica granatum]|uniref:Uncharacterized protein n=1 Tax=Punica granatum TaxID=22663 RepID=A0A218XS00_PUNGR|nr:hypothetical protein CDL15_Pgr022537 [Punica granatum]